MWQTAVGLAILAVVQNGLNLLDINTFYQYIIKGCLIIIAVSLDVWIRWLSGDRLLQAATLIRLMVPARVQSISDR
jgi:ribose/xylose/arabinose/galactoside ABC-type transport system permease subunit